MEINILHLYYDIMNLYGEYGNVCVLKKHLEDQGFQVNLDKKTIDDEIDFIKYSLIYIGCGTEKNMSCALKDLKKRTAEIRRIIENKTFIISTGNSMEMFGRIEGKEEGLEIFDYKTVIRKDRIVSDVIYKTEFSEEKVVGFINKMTETFHNMSPIFKVEYGIGENKRNDFEGFRYLNFYGTHILGPVLVKNPELLKELVTDIGKKVYKKFEYVDKDYIYEKNSHDNALNLIR